MAIKQAQTAVETVGLVHALFDQIGSHVENWATEHAITPQQAFLLRSLEHPIPMSHLAEEKGCDPSSLTGMIDRIEKLGLVERVAHPEDRRVRLIQLTSSGKAARASLEAHLAGLPLLATLTSPERTQLLALLRKASGSSC